jgi:hypothetical protein
MDKIRRDCYNHTEKALSLCTLFFLLVSDGKADKWVEILQHGDWSEIRKLCLGTFSYKQATAKFVISMLNIW